VADYIKIGKFEIKQYTEGTIWVYNTEAGMGHSVDERDLEKVIEQEYKKKVT
jgi:hypothetical protein